MEGNLAEAVPHNEERETQPQVSPDKSARGDEFGAPEANRRLGFGQVADDSLSALAIMHSPMSVRQRVGRR